MNEVTQLLEAVAREEPRSTEKLLPLVYDELRRLATAKLSRENASNSIDATGLVHEAYLRLVGENDQHWNHRGHFFASAANAMRRILVENARKRQQQKRGGEHQRVEFNEVQLAGQEDYDERLIKLDESLTDLESEDDRRAKVVKYRFFAGMTNEETAQVLGISTATAARDWIYARAWLKREMLG